MIILGLYYGWPLCAVGNSVLMKSCLRVKLIIRQNVDEKVHFFSHFLNMAQLADPNIFLGHVTFVNLAVQSFLSVLKKYCCTITNTNHETTGNL